MDLAPQRPAARYVRMSTEHMRYSTENQADTIAPYAETRGSAIVSAHVDEGRSSLSLDGRDALKRLITMCAREQPTSKRSSFTTCRRLNNEAREARRVCRTRGSAVGPVIDEVDELSSSYRHPSGSLVRPWSLSDKSRVAGYRYVETNRVPRLMYPGVVAETVAPIEGCGAVAVRDPRRIS